MYVNKTTQKLKKACFTMVVNHEFVKEEPGMFKTLWQSAQEMCDLLRTARVQDVFNKHSHVMMVVTCDFLEVMALAQFTVDKATAEIDILCTFPRDLRIPAQNNTNHNIGRFIMTELESYLKTLGVQKIELMSVIASLTFYKKMGFTAHDPMYPTYLSKVLT